MAILPQSPCPSDNLTVFVSAASQPFILYCGIDFQYSDLPDLHAATYKECIDACDAYAPNVTVANAASCIAVSWGNPVYSEKNCYLKYQIIAPEYNPSLFSARRAGYKLGGAPVLGSPFGLGSDTTSLIAGVGTDAVETLSVSVTVTVTSKNTSMLNKGDPTTSEHANVSSAATSTSLSFSAPCSNLSTTGPYTIAGLFMSSTTTVHPSLVSSSFPPAISCSSSAGLSFGNKVGLYSGIGIATILLFIALVFFVQRRNIAKRRHSSFEQPELAKDCTVQQLAKNSVVVSGGVFQPRDWNVLRLGIDQHVLELDASQPKVDSKTDGQRGSGDKSEH